MNGMIVVCFTLIAVVCCTFGAPVEIEPESKNVAVRASALLQPQSNSATVATASPLVSAKSSITEHQHHKRRRHHRRRHRLQRHRHKLYPLKDRLQKFVRGSSGSSNLLAGVKTPHQDFEMNNGEVFEHGGVPDLKRSSNVAVRRTAKKSSRISNGASIHALNETNGGLVVSLSDDADINSQLDNLPEGSGDESSATGDEEERDVGDVLYSDNSTLVLIHDFGKDNTTDNTLRQLLKEIPSVINDTGDALYNSNSFKSNRRVLTSKMSNKELKQKLKGLKATSATSAENILKSVSKFPPIKVHSNVGDFMMPDLHDIFPAHNLTKNHSVNQDHKRCVNVSNLHDNSTQQRNDILIRCGLLQPVSPVYTFETVGSDMVENPSDYDNGSTWHNFEDAKTTFTGDGKVNKEEKSVVKGEDNPIDSLGNIKHHIHPVEVTEKENSTSTEKGKYDGDNEHLNLDVTDKEPSRYGSSIHGHLISDVPQNKAPGDTSEVNSHLNLNVTDKGPPKYGSNIHGHPLSNKGVSSDSSKDHDNQGLAAEDEAHSYQNSSNADESQHSRTTEKNVPQDTFESSKYTSGIQGYLILPKNEKSSDASINSYPKEKSKEILNLSVTAVDQPPTGNVVTGGKHDDSDHLTADATGDVSNKDLSSNNTTAIKEKEVKNTDPVSNETALIAGPIVTETIPFDLPVLSMVLSKEKNTKHRLKNRQGTHEDHQKKYLDSDSDESDDNNQDENTQNLNSYHNLNHPADDYANEDALYEDRGNENDEIGKEENGLLQKTLDVENPNLIGRMHDQLLGSSSEDEDDRDGQFGDYADCNGVPYGCHRYFQDKTPFQFLSNKDYRQGKKRHFKKKE